MTRELRAVVVTGLSGSGKSTALGVLEDLGFYCVDNIPAGLLHTLIEHILAGRGLIDIADRMEKARTALEESHDDESLHRFAKLQEEYASRGGYEADSEIQAITAGLGLPDDRLLLPVRVQGETCAAEVTAAIRGDRVGTLVS